MSKILLKNYLKKAHKNVLIYVKWKQFSNLYALNNPSWVDMLLKSIDTIYCYIIAEGFWFVPLSLVRLRTFISAHGLVRGNIEAGVNAGAHGLMEVSLRCRNSPRRSGVTGYGWRQAPEVHGDLCENLKKVRVQDTRRRRSTFGACRREANVRPMGGSSWGPNESDNIEDCVSPPYVETFNSKLRKRFRTWTRSCYVFSNSEIYMFYCYEHSMSISPMAIFVYMAM